MRVLSIIFGILIAIGGFYCLMAPAATFLSLVWIIALVMIIDGIGNIITWAQIHKTVEGSGWLLAGAIISIIFGIIVLGSYLTQFIVGMIFVYMMAAWFVIMGIVRIVSAFKLRGIQKSGKKRAKAEIPLGMSWGWALAFGILMLIFGILSFMSPIFLASFIGIIVGITVIIFGINLAGNGFVTNKQ